MPSELAVQTAPKWRKKMKKLSLKYLFERIQKIEREYQRKPVIHTVILSEKYEKEAIKDLEKMGWERVDKSTGIFNNIVGDLIPLEKKGY